MNKVELIKYLREMTGDGMMDCKKTLQETNFDINDAIKILQKRPGIYAVG